MTTKWVLLRRPLLQSNTRALNHGREREYYGMRFDRGSKNFGFHMIAQSQLIADDRRRSQEIEHGSIFCDRLRSRSQDRRRSQKCVSIWSHTIADLLRSAICDPRSYGNQPLAKIISQINVSQHCIVGINYWQVFLGHISNFNIYFWQSWQRTEKKNT